MKTKRCACCVTIAMLLARCAATPPAPAPAPAPAVKETPASALADRSGDSIETAVAVPADAPNEGYDFENEWIWSRIGKFRRLGGGTGKAGERRYNVIDVETPTGAKHKFFFDITENWNHWNPPAPHH
jgi:hypothetical protein